MLSREGEIEGRQVEAGYDNKLELLARIVGLIQLCRILIAYHLNTLDLCDS